MGTLLLTGVCLAVIAIGIAWKFSPEAGLVASRLFMGASFIFAAIVLLARNGRGRSEARNNDVRNRP